MKHWSDDARAAAAARARRYKPWLHSTGPKTDIGKTIARMNALKHGLRSRIRAQPYRIATSRLRALERSIYAIRRYVLFKEQITRKKISDQRTELIMEVLLQNIDHLAPPTNPPPIDWAEYDAILNEPTPYFIPNDDL
jgi:hypothetical protein